MNHIYRTIWSHAQQCVVVVPETASVSGSASGGAQSVSAPVVPVGWIARLSVLVAALAGAGVVMAQALPTGGQVVAGSGQISQSGTQLTVNQGSDRLVTNWQSFNIGAGHSVQFNQPSASAVALNRVLGADVSSIQGALRANGQVFLLNPNGVVFSPTAQVNVGGLVASTLKLSDQDFMAGRYQLSGNSTQAIINQGKIEATQGGHVALVAARIVNDGQIKAPGGNVLLGAGQAVTLDFGGPVQMQVSQGALNAQIANGGAIVVEGGHVLLSAKAAANLGNAVVNQTGLIEATSLHAQGGSIRLSAEGGAIVQTGQLKANGQAGGHIEASGRAIVDAGQWSAQGNIGSGGKGGSIALQASQSLEQTAAAQLNASGAQGGGSVRIDGGASAYLSGSSKADSSHGGVGGDVSATADKLILAGAQLSANGAQGGGRVRVGGGWQGGDADIRNAASTTVTASSQLSANATGQGNGGTVVVWSEEGTGVAAKIEAKGGALGGHGGKVEASSKGALAFAAQVNVTAAKGQAGQVLLDPKNITISNGADSPSYTVTPLTYTNPQAGDSHGSAGAVELSNGNIVVASPEDSTIVAKAGAVRLYKVDGTLISTLTGGQAGDRVGEAAGYFLSGSTPVIPVGNGNFLVHSGNWANGTAAPKAGAVTWGSGTGGVSGVVSSSNSLVGSQADDQVGYHGITVLSNGNYVVASPEWANGALTRAGAVTWGGGNIGVSGEVSSSNSLVGQANDQVGRWFRDSGIQALSNGNYVVVSTLWNNGTASEAGAVTWGSGTAGVTGEVSSSNSLVGTQERDRVGSYRITELANGHYVVGSQFWANGTEEQAGAVTWGSGTAGVSGEVNSSNSLVGTQTYDQLGSQGVRALSNGNYVVGSSNWANGTAVWAGAVTWGNGQGGTSGAVSSSNSLVGTQANDRVGSGSITELANGNYVVGSSNWANGTATQAGAVTWVSSSGSKSGVVSSSNSLVGTQANDNVGSDGITVLGNGNYVVRSSNWANGTAAQAGAVTWGSGTAGAKGVVGSSNSLVGSQIKDQVGGNWIQELVHGNYVVVSYDWANGTATRAGAVTWGSGTAGVTGVVSSSNSLVGTQTNDYVGSNGVHALSNGNYVVVGFEWNNGTVVKAGAVTWGDGATGISGVVSSSNSMVGTQANDYVGRGGITVLGNGNYVVDSQYWANGTATKAGAVTWGSGTVGVSGEISSSNSLVGTQANDGMGGWWGRVMALGNGDYVVKSSNWANGTAQNAGAVTWVDGAKKITGVVSSSNSLVGTQANDSVGSGGITVLDNGNYVVASSNWANGTAAAAGAVTWVSSSGSKSGVVSSSNSLVGAQTNDSVGSGGITALANGDYVVSSSNWANGTAAAAGAVTWVSSSGSKSGVLSSSNSLLGTYTGDQLGSGGSPGIAGVRVLSNGAVLVTSSRYQSNQGRVDILSSGQPSPLLYALDPSANYNLNVDTLANLLATGAQVTLQANTNISLLDALKVNSAKGGDLTLQAGRSILLNADVHTGNGNLTLVANDTAASGVVDAHRDKGPGNIVQESGTTIDAGTGTVKLQVRDGKGIANAEAGIILLSKVRAGDLQIDSHKLSATLWAKNKVYDGLVGADAWAALQGLDFHNDSNLRRAPDVFQFADKNVGQNKVVTTTPLRITGFNGTQSSTLYRDGQVLAPTGTADITQRLLTVTATAANKVYDGNALAAATLAGNYLAGDDVSFAHSGGNFDSKNAGMGKTVTVGGITLAGADAGNYRFNTTATTQADITLRALNVAATAASKVYDGNTLAQLSFSDDRIAGDVLTLAGNGNFDDKNAGTGKTVTVGGITLAGADAGNYSFNTTATTQADITPRALDFTASKQADGSSRFDASQISLGNVIQGDQVLLSGSADVASPDVGRYRAFTVNALQSSNGNYSTQGGQVLATIVAQQLPLDPSPLWRASDVLQQEERDFPEPPQNALDLTVLGAKAPSQQLRQLH
ncbi:MAG: YDG domain-containing protein [Acidovorax sp.]|jgi:filamentous hemagglutinin family protein|nr:YDG domain-containing protein [Acidovorax sp.]